jgi:hypothetical protein
MSPFTKRMIMIGLWIPFAAYAAREWTGTVGRSGAAMPVSKLPDRDKAAKMRAEAKYKADVARAEVQASVSYTGVKSGPFKDALAEREWTMKNAQPFFDGANFRDKPAFGGEHALKFEPLFQQVKELVKCEAAFAAWDGRPVQLPASSALRAFDDDILKPFRDNDAPPDMIAKYSLRGRYKTLNAFAKDLARRYDTRLADSKTLPVERSDEIVPEIESLLKLYEECNKIDAPSVKTDTSRDEQDWKARLELLKLFAKDPVTLSPPDARVWFEDVNKHHGNLKDSSTQRLIREKVQQFCSQYVPGKLGLDDFVLLKVVEKGVVAQKTLKRVTVKALYEANGKVLDERFSLTQDPEGLNEQTKEAAPAGAPGGAKFHLYGLADGSTVDPKLVEPTHLSTAAFEYFKARQDVPNTNGWTRKSIGVLIGRAGSAMPGDAHIWNKLSRLMVAGEYKVYDRLKIVEEAIKKYTALFPE